MGGRLAASICYQMLLVNVFAQKRYCLSRNAPLEYISQRKSASRSEIIVWHAQKRGVCLFGGRGRWAKSPSPFRFQLPVSPNSFQSPRVPPAENSKMAAIGASEINKEESAEKNVSKIVQG